MPKLLFQREKNNWTIQRVLQKVKEKKCHHSMLKYFNCCQLKSSSVRPILSLLKFNQIDRLRSWKSKSEWKLCICCMSMCVWAWSDTFYRKLVNKTFVWHIDYGFGTLAYFGDILSIIRYNTSFVKRSASNDSVSSTHTRHAYFQSFSRRWKAAFLLFCINNRPILYTANIGGGSFWRNEYIFIYRVGC